MQKVNFPRAALRWKHAPNAPPRTHTYTQCIARARAILALSILLYTKKIVPIPVIFAVSSRNVRLTRTSSRIHTCIRVTLFSSETSLESACSPLMNRSIYNWFQKEIS